MMRALTLLALLGATPAPADITTAATCTLPRAETEAAFRALPLLSTEDDTEADERGTIYSFKDAQVWGSPARTARFSDYADAKTGSAMQGFETLVSGDYSTVRDRVIALHGKAQCDKEYGGGCDLFFANEGRWQHAMTISKGGDGAVLLSCLYSMPPQR